MGPLSTRCIHIHNHVSFSMASYHKLNTDLASIEGCSQHYRVAFARTYAHDYIDLSWSDWQSTQDPPPTYNNLILLVWVTALSLQSTMAGANKKILPRRPQRTHHKRKHESSPAARVPQTLPVLPRRPIQLPSPSSPESGPPC